MEHLDVDLTDGRPRVVGSFGNPDDLAAAAVPQLRELCDLAEIRLDLLMPAKAPGDEPAWRHLAGFPLLFTARRAEEGGARHLAAEERIRLLEGALPDASLIDVEVASLAEMGGFLKTLRLPWIASFHDFEKLPDIAVLRAAAKHARDAGAAAFKVAATLRSNADLAALADFQLGDHGLPVAAMGMGPLAPVSRLLCAQCGSVLNYGYIGTTPTAPGQWEAAFLKHAIARLRR
jgi:3-dehydroquinate dehydratase-1